MIPVLLSFVKWWKDWVLCFFVVLNRKYKLYLLSHFVHACFALEWKSFKIHDYFNNTPRHQITTLICIGSNSWECCQVHRLLVWSTAIPCVLRQCSSLEMAVMEMNIAWRHKEWRWSRLTGYCNIKTLHEMQ